jgi:hypothetical protein
MGQSAWWRRICGCALNRVTRNENREAFFEWHVISTFSRHSEKASLFCKFGPVEPIPLKLPRYTV